MTDQTDETIWNNLRIAGWSAAAIILLLPAIAMQFTNEVAWTWSDFAFAALMLGGTGIICELVLRHSSDNAYRLGALLALAAAFLLIWVNGAVGIVGSENNPVNLMYVGVLGVALFGSLAARFRPAALSAAMFATALAHALVTMIALVVVRGTPASDPVMIVLPNSFFIVLWLLSAGLFRKAADRSGSRATDSPD